ncbi:MAG: Hpt domain-containing protein, partial [Candidatus Heimdallarchaeota archaeon]|nr:Hpt domain-containing protein [Candidatus Heimdallarchaeota archaeon]
MSEYKDIFLSELEENIQLLNTSLIGIEKDNKDRALLKDLARAAHTIKGMAGTMGFDQLTKLTHEMENHLMGSRSITKAMIQTLFNSADRLQEFYDAVNTDKDPEKINVSDLVKQLKSGGDPSVVRKIGKKPTTVVKAVS